MSSVEAFPIRMPGRPPPRRPHPSECLVVGTRFGWTGRRQAAGCATLAVTTTTSRERLVGSGDADAVISTLADVTTFTWTAAGVRMQPRAAPRPDALT